jgi:hypothetical protein
MLKSIVVVVGSYLLSVILVLATNPLLSRLFPGDFVRGRIPSNIALLTSSAVVGATTVRVPLAAKGLACLTPGSHRQHQRIHESLPVKA